MNMQDIENMLLKLSGLDTNMCPCGKPYIVKQVDSEYFEMPDDRISNGLEASTIEVLCFELIHHQQQKCVDQFASVWIEKDQMDLQGG
jgi:hypothetical protein